MSVRPLVHIGEPVLREPAAPVPTDEIGSAEVQELVDDLIDTMHDAGGAGIAAPQIGVSLRVAVAEVDAHTRERYPYKPLIPLTVMINPQLQVLDDEGVEQINEGCLSVPGVRGVLPRAVAVRVRWLDRDSVAHDEVKRGVTAGTFQHEVDHLAGMVFLDRVTDSRTLMTWENYQRFHRDAFEARIAEYVARVGSMTAYACDHAWIDGRIHDDVVLELDEDRFAGVRTDATDFDVVRLTGVHLRGVTLPGFVNAHSHAFHRALRGRTHGGGGSFWTWREQMYDVAAALDPDSYHRLATAVFAEMLLAGITTVGEFHYLHHPAGGGRYDDPNAMGVALLAAAADVGIRITLLDALYLTADVGASLADPGLSSVQRRFSDGGVEAWASRVGAIRGTSTARVGAAIHSVRAVPAAQQAQAVAAIDVGMPLHAHVAEQPAEVEATLARHDRRPVGLLADSGAIDERFTAVHGVWLDDADIAALGAAGAGVCACPTTERDLADGIVPADRLLSAGVSLSLGTDQHVLTDMFEEARAVELNLRLATQRRGTISPETLLSAATEAGAGSLGWPELGRIEEGAPADLCVVGISSPRLAGIPPEALAAGIVFAATAADVTHTMVGGKMVVADGAHAEIDVAAALGAAIREVTP